MTEQEYIEAIRSCAEKYLEVIRNPSAFETDGEGWRRIKHWEAMKGKLSAHTAIALCGLWLETPDPPKFDRCISGWAADQEATEATGRQESPSDVPM